MHNKRTDPTKENLNDDASSSQEQVVETHKRSRVTVSDTNAQESTNKQTKKTQKKKSKREESGVLFTPDWFKLAKYEQDHEKGFILYFELNPSNEFSAKYPTQVFTKVIRRTNNKFYNIQQSGFETITENYFDGTRKVQKFLKIKISEPICYQGKKLFLEAQTALEQIVTSIQLFLSIQFKSNWEKILEEKLAEINKTLTSTESNTTTTTTTSSSSFPSRPADSSASAVPQKVTSGTAFFDRDFAEKLNHLPTHLQWALNNANLVNTSSGVAGQNAAPVPNSSLSTNANNSSVNANSNQFLQITNIVNAEEPTTESVLAQSQSLHQRKKR